ncbi:hypothetical protein AGLY_008728 [Aphis glycines]|uniref:Uncharacterized protein n=1 Tax=Aphis glycines TaxID=307491 RepID=A0A6G0TJT0_APHGL|nr:hypothetical protein AGLY_008728 [Aphis glycines]
MYSYKFIITIRITYEELCIKFLRPKKFYRHFKKIFSEKLKISVIFEEKFMENLVPNFQNLVIKEKNFTIFQPQNYLQMFAILTYFQNKKFDFDVNWFCVKNPIHHSVQNLKSHKNRKFQWSINNSKKITLTQTFGENFNLIENWFCVKIPVFLSLFFVFSSFLKTKEITLGGHWSALASGFWLCNSQRLQ